MAAATRVLLDPEHHQLTDGDPASTESLGRFRVLGRSSVGLGLLAGEVGARLVDESLVDESPVAGCSLEVAVAGPVERRRRLARHEPPTPVPLHLGEVAQQPGQRPRGRRH